MENRELSTADIEEIYDALAQSLDRVGTEQESKMLAKLALLLSNQLGDKQAVLAALRVAESDL